ncbi:MAG: exodeoxyribonuclease VII large subunit, partial [Nevskiaceae bacterium]
LAAGLALVRERGERLERAHPGRRLQQITQRLDELWERLGHVGPARLRLLADRLRARQQLLNSLNPQAILERGYAIARRPDGHVLTDAGRVGAGDPLEITLARGVVSTKVTGTKPA